MCVLTSYIFIFGTHASIGSQPHPPAPPAGLRFKDAAPIIGGLTAAAGAAWFLRGEIAHIEAARAADDARKVSEEKAENEVKEAEKKANIEIKEAMEKAKNEIKVSENARNEVKVAEEKARNESVFNPIFCRRVFLPFLSVSCFA